MMVNDRSDHRKLGLTSRKHIKPKPERDLCMKEQQAVLDFKPSLPLISRCKITLDCGVLTCMTAICR